MSGDYVAGKPTKAECHIQICQELTNMFVEKNADYGDAYALLRKEYPASICYRLTDKLNRLKTLYATDAEKPNWAAESITDTLMDIANYAIMELIERGMDEH